MTDPITDMLNRIKNAQAVGHKAVEIPYSGIKFEIGKVLAGEKFVDETDKHGRATQKMIRIVLKYSDGEPAIRGMRRLSKPGQRFYASYFKIPFVRYGKGAVIVSTSRGLMTDREARRKKIGGEILFEVW